MSAGFAAFSQDPRVTHHNAPLPWTSVPRIFRVTLSAETSSDSLHPTTCTRQRSLVYTQKNTNTQDREGKSIEVQIPAFLTVHRSLGSVGIYTQRKVIPSLCFRPIIGSIQDSMFPDNFQRYTTTVRRIVRTSRSTPY